MPDLGILGLTFVNNIIIFEISALKFVRLQNFAKKQKCLNFGPKMPYWVFSTKNAFFAYFWARTLKKTIVIFEISLFSQKIKNA